MLSVILITLLMLILHCWLKLILVCYCLYTYTKNECELRSSGYQLLLGDNLIQLPPYLDVHFNLHLNSAVSLRQHFRVVAE